MIEVLVLMFLGFAFGLILQSFPKIRMLVDRMTMWTIYLLLASMGFAIGSDSQLLKQLPTIGLQAIIITLGAVAGSVLLAMLLYPIIFKKRHENP